MARHDEVLEFLGRWADSLCTAVDDRPGASLLRVALTEDGLEVGVADLDGPPAEVLLGSEAPAEWVALGVAAGGWAHPLDDGQVGRGRRRRMRSVVIVHRSGEVVSRLRVGDDEVLREPPAHGLTLDGLQRALGLPTAPPLQSTGALCALMWLEEVIVAAEDRSRPHLGRCPGPASRLSNPRPGRGHAEGGPARRRRPARTGMRLGGASAERRAGPVWPR